MDRFIFSPHGELMMKRREARRGTRRNTGQTRSRNR
jgi:hypothetical protein